MVKGLEEFRKRFKGLEESYVLIGGTAASLIMEGSALPFRATKDLDIVLILETLDSRFGSVLWNFIEEGGYQNLQRSSGRDIFYRFYAPSNLNFPSMLELFSRTPTMIAPHDNMHLTPIPLGDEVASLSAILLDPEYYEFIRSGKVLVQGIPIVGADRLIPLKARAWLDLRTRRADGHDVDERDVLKHRNDIMRLAQVLDPVKTIFLPSTIYSSFQEALTQLSGDSTINLKQLGIRRISVPQIVDLLRNVFVSDSAR